MHKGDGVDVGLMGFFALGTRLFSFMTTAMNPPARAATGTVQLNIAGGCMHIHSDILHIYVARDDFSFPEPTSKERHLSCHQILNMLVWVDHILCSKIFLAVADSVHWHGSRSFCVIQITSLDVGY